MPTDKVTPRPWHVGPGSIVRSKQFPGYLVASILDSKGHPVATAHSMNAVEAGDRAALIIRAVNAHDALVEALNNVSEWLMSCDGEFFDPDGPAWNEPFRKALKTTRAALRAAGVEI